MAKDMLIDNHRQTILGLMKEGEALLERLGDTENSQKIREARLETEKRESPTIMFYGLYNAGKSTLINALCKKEVALTGDVPTTAAIQEVPWDGYTLIDTPGIDAHAHHTAIAENEIRRSDIVLFMMDNADTFDNAIVYQAIIDILKMGKALAIIINQKNVGDEDPNIPVPEQESMKKIVGKVSTNLERCGQQNGIDFIANQNNFLGIFPVNAMTAFDAAGTEPRHSVSGVVSLQNAINISIRRSKQVYMLHTPLICLRDILRTAAQAFQTTSIYGQQNDLAENRKTLIESRQRLRDRLVADGMRKIEAVTEQLKTAAANGQQVSGAEQRLNDELNTLIKEALGDEQKILNTEIKLEAMPDYHPVDSAGSSSSDSSGGGMDLQFGSLISDIPIMTAFPPIAIPVVIIEVVIKLIFSIFGGQKQNNNDAQEKIRRNEEQRANYYRWLNELRDYEIKIKASYEKNVNDALQKFYEEKFVKIDQELASVNETCAQHTKHLREIEQLQLRVGDEMASLVVA